MLLESLEPLLKDTGIYESMYVRSLLQNVKQLKYAC